MQNNVSELKDKYAQTIKKKVTLQVILENKQTNEIVKSDKIRRVRGGMAIEIVKLKYIYIRKEKSRPA